ncbi:MAG: hypothetical protein KJ044_12625, partial [Planctomycetes bacterium]|nr:hypothetical protein [Planctomycetota bacterium]
AIKIRTETIDYFLKRYMEDMADQKAKKQKLAELLEQKKRELLARKGQTGQEQGKSDPELAAVGS